VKAAARLVLRLAIGLLPPERRRWSTAALAELAEAETRRETLRWTLGGLKVVLLEGRMTLTPSLGALAVLACLAGAVVVDGDVVYVVAREGKPSVLALLAFLAPTALVGAAASALVLRRRPLGRPAAYAFFALVAITAVFAVTNTPPVATVFRDYNRAELAHGYRVPASFAREGWTAEQVLRHHSEERRFYGSFAALVVAVGFAFASRRYLPRRA
jgi:hypothetical protein